VRLRIYLEGVVMKTKCLYRGSFVERSKIPSYRKLEFIRENLINWIINYLDLIQN